MATQGKLNLVFLGCGLPCPSVDTQNRQLIDTRKPAIN
jgi:hypothetical protein